MLSITIFLLIAAAVSFSLYQGNIDLVTNSVMNSSSEAVGVVISLAGAMALWGGIMEVATQSGLTKKINKFVGGLLKLIFRGIDPNGEAMQAISMNVTANLLGIGNAATPLGIAAMKALVEEENAKGSTRNIALLVLFNTASIQLLPVTIGTMRLKYGSSTPFDCIIPVLINSLICVTIGCVMVFVLFLRRKNKSGIFRYNCTSNNMFSFFVRNNKKG